MAVVSLVVTQRTALARAARSGPDYEVLRGVATFAVDPKAEPTVVDLDLAARDAEGAVRFDADFVALQPASATHANRRLLTVVPNRGRIGTVPFSTRTTPTPAGEIDSGDGLLLEQGWALLYPGWQWDILEPEALGLRAPEALEDGRPIAGTVRVDFRLEAPAAHHRLADTTGDAPFATYTAADPEQADAELTVRDGVSAPARPIPRERWRFARAEGGAVVPDADSVWLEGGFQPYLCYEVRYRTSRSPVIGTGLLAVRDLVSAARYGDSVHGLLSAPVEFAYATGSSQTGRFLRQFVYEGLNLDEAGRPVFDGILPHIAGARRGEFNERFGQPSHIGYSGSSGLPPYSVDEPDGLFSRQRARGGVPKMIATNTAWEYWRSDAALNHIDPKRGEDRPESDDVRYYLFSGVDHLGASPLKAALAVANPPNPLGAELLLRAAFDNLVAWVEQGVAPPPSRVPRRADRSAVEREEVLAAFSALAGAELPAPALLPVTTDGDGEPLACFVSAVGADLNERAGVRLPEVAVPVASYTGWNRLPTVAALREFCGAAFGFSAGPDEEDPRGAAGELPPSGAAYEAAVEAAVRSLVADRLLLERDAPVALARALELRGAVSPDPRRPAR